MVKEVYFLIVVGNFEREPIIFPEHPTYEEIKQAIEDLNGNSAKIEKRYIIEKIQEMSESQLHII